MTPDEAVKILNSLDLTVSDAAVTRPGVWVGVEAGDLRACLDGDFTADELEALAMWMRDPSIGKPQ